MSSGPSSNQPSMTPQSLQSTERRSHERLDNPSPEGHQGNTVMDAVIRLRRCVPETEQWSAPSQQMSTLTVTSWAQVPHILKTLSNSDSSAQLRLNFPKPIDGSPEEKASIRAEQQAIHSFISKSRSKSFGELLPSLREKIAQCHLLKALTLDEATKTSALNSFMQDYGLERSEDSSATLSVKQIIPLYVPRSEREAPNTPQLSDFLTRKLTQGSRRDSSIIFEIPKSQSESLKIAAAIQGILNGENRSSVKLQNFEVWHGKSTAIPVRATIDEIATICSGVVAMSLEDFLELYGGSFALQESPSAADDDIPVDGVDKDSAGARSQAPAIPSESTDRIGEGSPAGQEEVSKEPGDKNQRGTHKISEPNQPNASTTPPDLTQSPNPELAIPSSDTQHEPNVGNIDTEQEQAVLPRPVGFEDVLETDSNPPLESNSNQQDQNVNAGDLGEAPNLAVPQVPGSGFPSHTPGEEEELEFDIEENLSSLILGSVPKKGDSDK